MSASFLIKEHGLDVSQDRGHSRTVHVWNVLGGTETRSVAVFKLCGFESWYRINFGSEESVRNEMDVPDTEIVDALPQ